MRLTILGSGAYAPSFKKGAVVRNPAGHAVEVGGEVLLLDLGFGNVRQLARAGLDASRVQDVFITHRHPDHCADLAALLFLYRYGAKPASGRLRVWGPVGFRAFLERLSAAYAPWLEPEGYELEAGELEEGQRVKGAKWTMECMTTPHPTPSLAYRLTSGGKTLVYSGDTGPSERLTGFAKGCDLLLLEATTDKPFAGHLSAEQAVDTAAEARTLFTHLSAESEAALKPLLRGKPRLRLARDLLRVTL